MMRLIDRIRKWTDSAQEWLDDANSHDFPVVPNAMYFDSPEMEEEYWAMYGRQLDKLLAEKEEREGKG